MVGKCDVDPEKADTECDIEEGEFRVGNGRPEPKEPTAVEVARHNLTHMPYRSWCPHCVAARRTNDPHARGSADRQKPLLVLDYCWITDLSTDGGVWALAGRMYPNQALFAVMCNSKGATDKFVVLRVCQFLRECGYADIVYKGDQ